MVRMYEQHPVGPEGRGQGRLPVGGEASSVLAERWSRSLYLPCQEQPDLSPWVHVPPTCQEQPDLSPWVHVPPRRQGSSDSLADLNFPSEGLLRMLGSRPLSHLLLLLQLFRFPQLCLNLGPSEAKTSPYN